MLLFIKPEIKSRMKSFLRILYMEISSVVILNQHKAKISNLNSYLKSGQNSLSDFLLKVADILDIVITKEDFSYKDLLIHLKKQFHNWTSVIEIILQSKKLIKIFKNPFKSIQFFYFIFGCLFLNLSKKSFLLCF